jgi:putative MATE family efflux protein
MMAAAAPKFVEGSTMRHVVVMTATGSLGLMAIFVVDFLDLFYISLLGEQELAAAIGYAGTILFFMTSLCIGVTIAATALVSRALGASRREDSRRLGISSLLFMFATTALVSAAMLPLLAPILSLLGATGRTHDIAWRFLMIVTPSTPLLGLGMAASGLLRSIGDARRAMYVTLAGAVVTALLDPVFIFVLGLGVDGAAIVSILSRLALTGVGLYGCIRIHDMLARPNLAAAIRDTPALAAIAVPAVLANVATPIAFAYTTAAVAAFGDSAVAGYAVINRVSPLAFCAIFALSGSVGPILGQNLGARRYDRIERTLSDSLIFILIYCVVVWGMLLLLQEAIVQLFGATEQAAALVRFFCRYVAGAFIFLGALFVANAAFNNLGFATWSTLFNWGRATLGTIPFVAIGAAYFGAEGVLAGQAAGGVAFGIAAVMVCYRVVRRMAKAEQTKPGRPALTAPAIPPFSDEVAAAIDLAEGAEKNAPAAGTAGAQGPREGTAPGGATERGEGRGEFSDSGPGAA